MKHLILGTAGHIDHGKTALVKALTGTDCDTHKEEKLRGITINLGFAHLDLPSGLSVGIVDVPGHRDFVHTMVAGASGIDFALMVIAADEGVMPQTREHMQIMQILGIADGIIVLTKTDKADASQIADTKSQLAAIIPGTFLEHAETVGISSITGDGIDELKNAIDRCATRVLERPGGSVFRLFVDRRFSKSGFGTIITGSVRNGSVKTGATAYLLPSGKQLRVRRLERHGREVDEISAGDRASLNLVGLDLNDFARGMVIAGRPLNASVLLDCRVELFAHSQTRGLWSSAIFLLGTFESQARIHCIDTDSLTGGAAALAQIHLETPCVAQPGDRFVLRSTSSDVTVGGGEVIDASPLHHRRRTRRLIGELQRIAGGTLPELVAMEVRKRRGAVSADDLAVALNASLADITQAIDALTDDDIVVFDSGAALFCITGDACDAMTKKILESIADFHRKNPLRAEGLTSEQLAGMLGVAGQAAGDTVRRSVLAELEQERKIRRVKNTWALDSHTVSVDSLLKEKIDSVESFLSAGGMQVPLESDIEKLAAQKKIDRGELSRILHYLVAQNRAYSIEGNFLHASVVDPIRQKLLAVLVKTPGGFTVAQFRDLIGGNRKICLLLYALFDREGITVRKNDVRIITEKGRSIPAGKT